MNTEENKVGLFEAAKPCGNCPYRTDAPLKLWHKEEFKKLLEKENQQFGTIYKCHKNNGSVCVGWLMKQKENGCPSIALRIALIRAGDIRKYLDNLSSPAPLYKNVRAMIKANFPTVLKKPNKELEVHECDATMTNQGTKKLSTKMKSLISILLFITITSCHIERTWIVKSYSQDYINKDLWSVTATSGKKTKVFLIECSPDSVNQKFKW